MIRPFSALPLLDDLTIRLENGGQQESASPLAGVAVIGIQPLHEATGSLVEALCRLGARPEHIFLAGRIDTVQPGMLARLQRYGVHVAPPSPPFVPGEYEAAFEADLRALWQTLLSHPDRPRFRAIVILDQDDQLAASIPEMLARGKTPIRGVVLGTQRLPTRFPVVEVTGSCLNRHLQPQLRAQSVSRILRKRLRALPSTARIGILGLGGLGDCVARAFREHGFRPMGYDRAHRSASGSSGGFSGGLANLLRQSDVVLGCSGQDSLLQARITSPFLDSFLEEPKLFWNCTSRDQEFRSLLRRIPISPERLALNPLSDLKLSLPKGALTVARGGFSVLTELEPGAEHHPESQLLSALILGGIVQSVSQSLEDAPDAAYRLSSRLQDYLWRRFFELRPDFVVDYPRPLLQALDNAAWIEAQSSGAPSPVSLMTASFRGRRIPIAIPA